MLPFISVILPVRNERTMLPRLIDELLKQNYPADRFEILVVDGRSTDGTADLVRRRYSDKHVKVRVLDNPKMLSSAGRNVGVRAAAGEVIVFIDGHCAVPSRNLLEDTVAILRQTGAGCLCRSQPLLAPSATPTGEVIAEARASWLGHGRDSAIDDMRTCGSSIPQALARLICAKFSTRWVFTMKTLTPAKIWSSTRACRRPESGRISIRGLRCFTRPARICASCGGR